MSRLKQIAGERAHERALSIVTYGVDKDHVVMEGRLTDERARDYYLVTGERRPAGELHNLIIRLLINIPEMAIEEVEAEMVTVPREECHEIIHSLEAVKGLKITRGFSAKIHSLLRGVKGCTHLVTLLMEMAPAAIQGIWSYKAQKPWNDTIQDGDQFRLKSITKNIANSCYVWREEGPSFKKLQKNIEEIMKK